MLVRLVEAFKTLSEKYSWEEIFIFGSITRNGAFHDGSDVDIGIEGLDPLIIMPSTQIFQVYWKETLMKCFSKNAASPKKLRRRGKNGRRKIE